MSLRKCNCNNKTRECSKFLYEDHTLYCYHGFKVEYRHEELYIKLEDNEIKHFNLCHYCKHYRCNHKFNANKTKRIKKRRICDDCCVKVQLRSKALKNNLTYSCMLQKWISKDGNDVMDWDELSSYLSTD